MPATDAATAPASTRRRYDDACGTAHALELVGERWALLVVRELLLGPRRFTDLREALPGISPNVLAQRLEELEAASVLRRRRLPPPAASRVYELTEWGAELEPVIRDIGRWAARSPTRRPGLPIGVTSLVISFRTMFSPAAAAGLRAAVALRLGPHGRFVARVADGALEVAPGEADAPDAALAGAPDDVAAVVYGGRPLDEAIAAGALRAGGDLGVLRRFVGLFPLPPRAPANPAPDEGA